MTLAIYLRLVLLIVVIAATALAAWLLPHGAPPWVPAIIGVAAPFLFAPAALAIEFTAGAILDPRRPRCTPRDVVRIWWQETVANWHAFLWRQPFAERADGPVTPDPQRCAVLLIHGYLCNRAIWQPMLDAGVLRDCNVATVNLQPVFGSIEQYADVVAGAVDRLLRASGAARVVLVGHSMGGLAARTCLKRHGDARIARVITLATPHYGTIFARLGFGTSTRQMARGSAFLADLAAGETPELRARFVCVATRDDNLIVPRSSPLLEGAIGHVLDGVGHLALIEDPRAWRIVADEIRSVRGAQ